jgi:hypothetical protein
VQFGPADANSGSCRLIVRSEPTESADSGCALKSSRSPTLRPRVGQYSVRLNDQFRVCFVWTEQGAAEVEIVDYHEEGGY